MLVINGVFYELDFENCIHNKHSLYLASILFLNKYIRYFMQPLLIKAKRKK